MLEDTRDFVENTTKEQLKLLPRTNHKSCTPHLSKKHETLCATLLAKNTRHGNENMKSL
jgi:hypothetical protein